MLPMGFTFEGDPGRPLLLFRAVNGPFMLRATVFQGAFTRTLWEAFKALNNGVLRPSVPVEVSIPRTFCGSPNSGADRRLMVMQPMGAGPTVFKFDQPIPLQLPDAIRRALAPVVAPPALGEVPRAAGEPDEEHDRQRHDLPLRPEGQPRPRKRGRHGKSAKGKLQHRAQQRQG